LLAAQCQAALSAVGLDAYIGMFHDIRPGRASLALDLMEEFRPMLVDRIVVRWLNLRQFNEEDFEETPGGGVFLTEPGRKKYLILYENYRQEIQSVKFLPEGISYGMLPHLQARLLARSLRESQHCVYQPWVFAT
jgi:CRISPR-associated protein Cas1